MKVSYNWLKEYLSCDLTAEQLAEAMTSIGIEVDSVEFQEEIPGGLAGVVVAKVRTTTAGSRDSGVSKEATSWSSTSPTGTRS